MYFLPKGSRDGEGIDPLFLPPGALAATPVQFAMVQQGDCKSVADLAPTVHGPANLTW
jgi:hypothetical protein